MSGYGDAAKTVARIKSTRHYCTVWFGGIKWPMVDLTKTFDVLVIGGGNAAMCAAISARQSGASVLVLEAAHAFYR
ncbi:MAG: FAD-dependent oxidoreductase, partial [Rhodospirillaceae bacterium]